VAVNTTTWTGGTLLFTQSVADFAFEATAALDPCIYSYNGGANIHILYLSHAAWKSPVAGLGSIEAKCVLPNQGCTAPAQGTSFVDASGKAKQGTVTGLSTATTYDCYVVADPKLLTKDKCSKPVRITTLASPTLVYKSSVTPVTNGRKLLQNTTVYTSRCSIGPTGDFTDCVNSELDNDTIIENGVVDPNKQFITFGSPTLSGPDPLVANDNLTTCAISPAGIIDSNTCVTAYSPPGGFDFYGFDRLARRVWFSLSNDTDKRLFEDIQGKDSDEMTQRSLMEYPGDIYTTCAINAKGEYIGCTQSQPVPGLANLFGQSLDASGFYVGNVTSKGLAFCQNDFACNAVTGIPVGNDTIPVAGTEAVFLTANVVYFVRKTKSNNAYSTYRCKVQNPTTFTDCQTVFESLDTILNLLEPANNGLNAYVYEIDDKGSTENDIIISICDVNQVTGVFENCKQISTAPQPIFSFPIVF
jgi:hypothetical protein